MHALPYRCDIQTFLQAVGMEFTTFPKSYLAACRQLGISNDQALRIAPNRTVQNWKQKNEYNLEIALQDHINASYFQYFIRMRNLQRQLVRPLINKQFLRETIEAQQHIGVKEQLQNFEPDNLGLAQPTVYSNVGTATGRLTVVEGPNPLVMKTDAKKIIRSSFRNGRILQLDLSAAEPRTALNLLGKVHDGIDLYESIAQNILDGSVTRQIAKQIVICALYGQSARKLSEMLPSAIDAASIIDKVKDFFEINRLISLIKSNEFKNNTIRNALGRPIIVPDGGNLTLSYYLQSSAAEISVLLFSDFCDRMQGWIKPHYIIHDALVFDCNEEGADYLTRKEQIVLRHGSWVYPIKISEIC